MMGHRLLVAIIAITFLALSAPAASPAGVAGPPDGTDGTTFRVAKNDRPVMEDRKGGGDREDQDEGLAKGKGKGGQQQKSKAGKRKGLDQAAMNQVRNAYKFLEQGKPEKALQELEKARRMAPDNYWVNYYSAGAYHELKDYAQARRFWADATASAETPVQRSRVRTASAFTDYLASGVEPARASLSVAVQMDGGNVKARELLAQVATPARPGQPQAGASIRLGDVNEFLGYFMVKMP